MVYLVSVSGPSSKVSFAQATERHDMTESTKERCLQRRISAAAGPPQFERCPLFTGVCSWLPACAMQLGY